MRRRKPPHILFLPLILAILWQFHGTNAQSSSDVNNPLGGMSASQGSQIFSEIMEIFAPSSSTNSNRRRTPEKSESGGIQSWKQLLGSGSSSNRDSAPAIATGRAGGDTDPWAQLTNGMFGLFRTTTRAPPTTTTQPSIFQTFYEKLNPFASNRQKSAVESSTPSNFLFPNNQFTLFPTPTTTSAPSLLDWLVGGGRTTTKAPVQALLEPFSTFLRPGEKSSRINNNNNLLTDSKLIAGGDGATEIDTGGPNTFDRIVVREKLSRDSADGSGVSGIFSNILGGEKFNEKGIQWHDGNLRFVNKNGNKLLGSEVAVHDRSVDIPVTKWFRIASDLASSAYQNSPNT